MFPIEFKVKRYLVSALDIEVDMWFLAGLHKVHPAYRMVNAGRVGGRL
jgi:hypothetical protein